MADVDATQRNPSPPNGGGGGGGRGYPTQQQQNQQPQSRGDGGSGGGYPPFGQGGGGGQPYSGPGGGMPQEGNCKQGGSGAYAQAQSQGGGGKEGGHGPQQGYAPYSNPPGGYPGGYGGHPLPPGGYGGGGFPGYGGGAYGGGPGGGPGGYPPPPVGYSSYHYPGYYGGQQRGPYGGYPPGYAGGRGGGPGYPIQQPQGGGHLPSGGSHLGGQFKSPARRGSQELGRGSPTKPCGKAGITGDSSKSTGNATPDRSKAKAEDGAADSPDDRGAESSSAAAPTRVEPMRSDFHFYVDDVRSKHELLSKASVLESLPSDSPFRGADGNPDSVDPYLLFSHLNDRLMKAWEGCSEEVRGKYLGKEEEDRRRFMSDEEIASRHCATLTARAKSPKAPGQGRIKEEQDNDHVEPDEKGNNHDQDEGGEGKADKVVLGPEKIKKDERESNEETGKTRGKSPSPSERVEAEEDENNDNTQSQGGKRPPQTLDDDGKENSDAGNDEMGESPNKKKRSDLGNDGDSEV